MDSKDLDGPLAPSRSSVAVGHLPNDELEYRLKRLAGIERKALTLLLAHLGEFDLRRLHAERGHPSLFSYCLRVLGYSEQAAYKRIQAARAARAHPEILRRLESGELTLTAAVILSPHLRADNALELLDAARGRRTREVEALAAGLAPRPDSPDFLRALPVFNPEAQGTKEAADPSESDPSATDQTCAAVIKDLGEPAGIAGGRAAPRPRELVEALSAGRYLFRFTGSSELRAKYERTKELLGAARSVCPMETVVEAGLDTLLDKLDPERRIARRRARAARLSLGVQQMGDATDIPDGLRRASRRISTALRDAVWERDGGRCTFTGPGGARCPATAGLEIDHVQPYALGGPSDDAANLRVMCRAHNQLLARRIFGAAAGPRPGNQKTNYP